MSDTSDLSARIDATIQSTFDKLKQQQQKELQNFQEQQRLLKEYEVVQATIVDLVKPRLQALANRAGDRVKVTPSVAQTRRAATFVFKSSKTYMTLTVAVAPDYTLRNACVQFDLSVVPVLWKFDSHSEISTPVEKPDLAAVSKWLDDRIIGFVELFMKIHEQEVFDKAEFVEDPIAKIKFPKFAAGATLEQGGKTLYFIDEKSKTEFTKK